ncbi:phage portal protein [Sulfitobacter sp.]|uniref:phage portal protein n=1 Tax=Sulfitobacter sp. TaxID=1903071 RepID=UPI003F6D5496
MAFWNRKAKGVEARSASFTQAEPRSFLEIFGLGGSSSVSMEEALGVPAVWAAVNFLSGTIAGLPLHVYDKTPTGKKRVKATKANAVVGVLHDAVNDDYSSFQWRFDMMKAVFTEGRFVTYIERDEAGRVINLFPLPNTTVKRLANGRKQYECTLGGKKQVYDQSEVLDVTFLLKDDLLSHRSPLRQCAVAIGKAVNANDYGSKLFKNGGLPAFTLQGPFETGKSAQRAATDIAEATREAARKGGNVLAIPSGHKLDPLGSDPEKMQLVQTQEFAVIEIARIYSLPPTFLQDLSRATFSNSEQQDLHLVKHTLKRWTEQLEAEMNLKFFPRGSSRIVEFNMDGILRGDFKTRMDGNARAIQTGQMTPNEARDLDNREPLDGGEQLYIQGATVPLVDAGKAPAQPNMQEEPADEV